MASDKRPVSEMRNLGPMCERDLYAAGIHTAGDLNALDDEQAFLSMLQSWRCEGRNARACNAAADYALNGAIHDLDWLDVPKAEKQQLKMLAAETWEPDQYELVTESWRICMLPSFSEIMAEWQQPEVHVIGVVADRSSLPMCRRHALDCFFRATVASLIQLKHR